MVDRIGKQVTERHGKQKYYTQPQIQSAATAAGYPIDIHCWAYCVFMDLDGFDSFHQSIGEVCDYSSMKSTMLEGIASSGSLLKNINLSWREWPSIDLSGALDWFKKDGL